MIGKGKCLVSGLAPVSCYAESVSSVSDCEEACTAHELCVGYYYSADSKHCHLAPTESSCPTGFELINDWSGAFLANAGPLEAESSLPPEILYVPMSEDFNCYGKN